MMMTHISAEHIAEHEAALTGLLAWAALSADDLAALAVLMGPFDTWPPTGRQAVLVYAMLRRHLVEGMTPEQLRAFVHRMAASKQAQAQAPRSEVRRRAPGRQQAEHTQTLRTATGVPR
jgi:hypothetical protein